MSTPNPSNFALLIRLFKKHVILLMAPVALFLALAAGYILTAKPEWKATQSIQIRDELALQTVMPGRFDSLDMMKMVQETIHDTARRHAVVTRVLSALEPPEDHQSPDQWPTIKDVESLQEAISLSPPNGAEFGRTEILLLSVKSSSIERAKKTVGILASELQTEINHLRDQRGLSMENEIKATVASAKTELDHVSEELSEFEKGCGEILIDLRGAVSESGSGSSGLLEQKATLQKEMRIAKQNQLELKNQIDAIQIAKSDPNNVLSFSRELLAAQPTLQKLKEQLITIQAQTAEMLGKFEEFHPKARAAMKFESIVRQEIQKEVDTAYNGIIAQIRVVDAQIVRLQQTYSNVEKQISKLAQVRAPYAEIVQQVEHKRIVLNQALQDLSRAHATRAAAKTTNLISLIDGPYSGSKPEGLSKKIILATSGVAGLLSGIGLVFFAASPNFVTRLDDQAEQVHQTSDQQPEWRREILQEATDEAPANRTLPKKRRSKSLLFDERRLQEERKSTVDRKQRGSLQANKSTTNAENRSETNRARDENTVSQPIQPEGLNTSSPAPRVAIVPDESPGVTNSTCEFEEESESTIVDFNEIQIGDDIRQILEASEEGIKNKRVKPMPLPRTKSPIAFPPKPVDAQASQEPKTSSIPTAYDEPRKAIETNAEQKTEKKTDVTDEAEHSEAPIEDRLQEAHRRRIAELLSRSEGG